MLPWKFGCKLQKTKSCGMLQRSPKLASCKDAPMKNLVLYLVTGSHQKCFAKRTTRFKAISNVKKATSSSLAANPHRKWSLERGPMRQTTILAYSEYVALAITDHRCLPQKIVDSMNPHIHECVIHEFPIATLTQRTPETIEKGVKKYRGTGVASNKWAFS